MSLKLLGKAAQATTYLIIQARPWTQGYKTTHKLWIDQRLVIDHLQVFDSIAYTHIPKANQI
jgi:hypothetical protein